MSGRSLSNKDLGVEVVGDDAANCCSKLCETVKWWIPARAMISSVEVKLAARTMVLRARFS